VAGSRSSGRRGRGPTGEASCSCPRTSPRRSSRRSGRTAVTSFHALHLRDYARFDFRLTADHKIYLIEANPNPYLQSSAEFVKGARASGRTHPQTILEIVELALARYGARA